MTPTEFTLWLNGATDVVDGVPSPEQWMQIKEKLSEAMGHLAKRRLLERAEDLARSDEEMANREAFAKAAMDLKIREMQSETIDEHQRRLQGQRFGYAVEGIARNQIYGAAASGAISMAASQEDEKAKLSLLGVLQSKFGGAA